MDTLWWFHQISGRVHPQRSNHDHVFFSLVKFMDFPYWTVIIRNFFWMDLESIASYNCPPTLIYQLYPLSPKFDG